MSYTSRSSLAPPAKNYNLDYIRSLLSAILEHEDPSEEFSIELEHALSYVQQGLELILDGNGPGDEEDEEFVDLEDYVAALEDGNAAEKIKVLAQEAENESKMKAASGKEPGSIDKMTSGEEIIVGDDMDTEAMERTIHDSPQRSGRKVTGQSPKDDQATACNSEEVATLSRSHIKSSHHKLGMSSSSSSKRFSSKEIAEVDEGLQEISGATAESTTSASNINNTVSNPADNNPKVNVSGRNGFATDKYLIAVSDGNDTTGRDPSNAEKKLRKTIAERLSAQKGEPIY